MAPAGMKVSAALALASNSEIVVASSPIKNIKNTRMMLFSLRSLNTSANLLLHKPSALNAKDITGFPQSYRALGSMVHPFETLSFR